MTKKCMAGDLSFILSNDGSDMACGWNICLKFSTCIDSAEV